MCLIRVRPGDEEEVIATRTRTVRPSETTTVITPIPPAPAPPPPVRLSNALVPTTAVYDAIYDDSYHTANHQKYHDHTSSQQYAVSVINGPPLPIIKHEDSERLHRSDSRHRRHRHRHRSGSREREVTTYNYRESDHDAISVNSGISRSRSVDYRRNSGYYGQSPRSSYRYIDPRGSSNRVVSGGTATISTTAMNGHKRAISASETRGRERSRERQMLTYGNPRLSTASYRSYGGGRKSRERIIMVDDEHERVKYYTRQ